MATRFYLDNTSEGTLTPSFDAGWTRNADGARFKMSPTKDGSAMVADTFWTGNPAANSTCLARQYISAPLSAGIGFVTTDTVKLVIRGQESGVNDNVNRCPVCIKVISRDGTTVQATLLGLSHYGPNTTEWNTSLRNKQFLDGDALTANYTTVLGDRLLIEVGAQVDASGGTSVTGTLSFGSNSATDLAENETGTAADNPWFEISRTVTFATDLTALVGVGRAVGVLGAVVVQAKTLTGSVGVARAVAVAGSLVTPCTLTGSVAVARAVGVNGALIAGVTIIMFPSPFLALYAPLPPGAGALQ